MKKTYTILIEETVTDLFSVEADSKEQAIQEAVEKYHRAEFVLAPGHLEKTRLRIVSPDGDPNWEDL